MLDDQEKRILCEAATSKTRDALTRQKNLNDLAAITKSEVQFIALARLVLLKTEIHPHKQIGAIMRDQSLADDLSGVIDTLARDCNETFSRDMTALIAYYAHLLSQLGVSSIQQYRDTPLYQRIFKRDVFAKISQQMLGNSLTAPIVSIYLLQPWVSTQDINTLIHTPDGATRLAFYTYIAELAKQVRGGDTCAKQVLVKLSGPLLRHVETEIRANPNMGYHGNIENIQTSSHDSCYYEKNIG